MGAIHEERLAKNEAFFRVLNERIRDLAAGHGNDGHAYEFVCECGDVHCVDRVTLTLDEYETVRADGARFVLAPGHDVAEAEFVVASKGDHVIVEKVGMAGAIAEQLDPRAA